MITERVDQQESLDQALHELSRLRQWSGSPREFWDRLASGLARATGAGRVVVVTREGEAESPWKKIADYSAYTGPMWVMQRFAHELEVLAQSGSVDPPPLVRLHEEHSRTQRAYALYAALEADGTERRCGALLLLVEVSEQAAADLGQRLRLATDIPRSYALFREGNQARSDVQKLGVVLDLMVSLNAEKRFVASTISLANAVANQFGCDRVSLGWLERGYVRLRAMSRTEQFNRRMAAAGALEAAMEEALDQDADVVFPLPEEGRLVVRDHERYAADQRCGYLASLPLREDGQPVAVLTCERVAQPFQQVELQQLRLTCDLAARRLIDLKEWDRWFGARWVDSLRRQAAKWVTPEHTWAKLLALLIAVALAVVVFGRVNYRVEGDFLLRSDEVTYLTAPYDSYIKQVNVRPGDLAAAGAVLLQLDTEDLQLEQTAAAADLNRYQREAEKARASSAFADMRVAEALARQASARLELVQSRLSHASLTAPYASIVIEGDLRERLGAPVKQGDALLQVARLDRLYVEAAVNERDIHEVVGRETGQIAFVSQPRLKFPIRIERIEPAAVQRKAQNVFLVRCALVGPAEPWWRPGMSGVCKLNVGKRPILWIFTHRTVDFLRLLLWW